MNRKLGPLPIWAWAVAAVTGVYLLHRWRSHRQLVDTGIPGGTGLQPVVGLIPNAITPVDAMSTSVVSTPVANGVGSQTLQGSTRFTVPRLSFTSVGAGTGGGGSGGSGLEKAGTVQGYTADQVAAAAARYASGRSYGGVPYQPHMVMQESHIETRGGVPGVMVKYSTPGYGDSTEWTPLG